MDWSYLENITFYLVDNEGKKMKEVPRLTKEVIDILVNLFNGNIMEKDNTAGLFDDE